MTAVELEGARANLRRVLAYAGRVELADRIVCIENPVPASFGAGDSGPRDRVVVSVGRWDDPQKNARLLGRVLREYGSRRPSTRFVLIGNASGSVCESAPQVTSLGRVGRDELGTRLSRRARVPDHLQVGELSYRRARGTRLGLHDRRNSNRCGTQHGGRRLVGNRRCRRGPGRSRSRARRGAGALGQGQRDPVSDLRVLARTSCGRRRSPSDISPYRPGLPSERSTRHEQADSRQSDRPSPLAPSPLQAGRDDRRASVDPLDRADLRPSRFAWVSTEGSGISCSRSPARSGSRRR